MIKVLAVVSLTAFLSCYGVQSAELSNHDLSEQILNSGTVVFLDFLEKVRNATEKIVKDDQFRKTRITVQRLVKNLNDFAKPMKNAESGSQDNSTISLQKFFSFMADAPVGATIREIFDKFFFPYMNIYRQSFKNETMVEIWKEMESYYLPGAPPIYSKPMEFLSYLLGKAVQVVMDQIRQKAFEISILERQKEKNDFLISLRTASRLIVFYWDKVLEHTGSPLFHAIYLDSMNWTERHFDKFIDALALEYYSRGNEALGLDRFNQSNWAIVKSAVVCSLPVYKHLSEVGFGITEINRFLNRVNHITLIFEGNDESRTFRQTYLEISIRGILYLLSSVIEEEISQSKDNQLLLPLRVIRKLFLDVWSFFLMIDQFRGFDETEHQQSINELNRVTSVIINELLKSKAFTREQLEEAPKNFIQAIHQILEKLKQHTDLVDGFDENIDPTALNSNMYKSLAILILAVLLSKGVESVSLTDEDYEMADKLFTLGAEGVLKYLDNLKKAAEVVVEENKINKTGTDMQDLWISLKEMVERIAAEERVKGQDHFIVSLHIFHRLGSLYGEGLFRLLSAYPRDNYGISRELGVFKGIIKNETLVDLWKYVESRYLPGAPPIYSDPVGFLGHLLSKIAQTAIHLVKEKAMEISTLERQTEKDEFLITLRTASEVLAFYWDKLLEYTESQPFHNKYLDAVRKWKELRVLKDTKKYHTITNPETGLQAWTWADERFGNLFDNAALEYDRWGNGIFGDDRFNQSNWAIMKMATVYPLPIYERFSESGLGISEVNDFFIDTDDALNELVGEDILYSLKGVLNELWNIFSNEILHVSINKKNQMTSDVEYEDPLRHLRHWDEVRSIFIKELIDSGKLTQQKLDGAQKINVQKLMKSLREFAKPIKNAESGSQDNSAISPQRFFSFMADAPVGETIREISDKFFFPYMNSYRQSFKNEMMVEIWKEMESYYLPGAPPIYSKPMEFFSYLLGKAVQVVMDQIRMKAFEISILERQKEKNDFLISLRQWEGLVRNALANGENQWLADHFLKWWTELHFGKFIELALEYYSHGNEAIGLDRFNQSNWAFGKSAVVYSLPVYEKLSEVGFGITEINRFLNRVNNITLILDGKNPSKPYRRTFLEKVIRDIFSWINSVIEEEKTNSKDNKILLPLRELNRVRSDFINELLKSKAFTREQLEEAPKAGMDADISVYSPKLSKSSVSNESEARTLLAYVLLPLPPSSQSTALKRKAMRSCLLLMSLWPRTSAHPLPSDGKRSLRALFQASIRRSEGERVTEVGGRGRQTGFGVQVHVEKMTWKTVRRRAESTDWNILFFSMHRYLPWNQEGENEKKAHTKEPMKENRMPGDESGGQENVFRPPPLNSHSSFFPPSREPLSLSFLSIVPSLSFSPLPPPHAVARVHMRPYDFSLFLSLPLSGDCSASLLILAAWQLHPCSSLLDGETRAAFLMVPPPLCVPP
ncbi:hypothetical protein DPX16_11454 [Anabarilius grahami]|uniref:Uncharacterized protein n=1 Tax=Anabarilius grahami TaxID=495550 RepID=A0A3N0YHN5_ANAGA|nr:hypothetical protein DPX16_11454 [Anabarilius grahami]